MRAVSDRLSLAVAQLALARDYGFPSWDALKTSIRKMRREVSDSEFLAPADGGAQSRCSFCGKSEREVERMIVRRGIYICERCVDLLEQPSSTTNPEAIELADYTFPLPPGFHVSDAETGTCRAPVIFRGTVTRPPGSRLMAAAASASGKCLRIVLTDAFTPTTSTPNGYLPFTKSTPDVHRVDINGFVGWIGVVGATFGQPLTQLTVELPQRSGQMRVLAVSSTDLRGEELFTLAFRGLSSS